MKSSASKELFLPDFDVLVNKSPIPLDAELQLIGITVDEDVNIPSMFTLEFAGLDERPLPDIPLIDKPNLFEIGSEITVKLGYHHGKLETVMIGEIVALEPEFHFQLPPSLRVRGYDRRHRLLRGRKTRTFLNKTDSQIATQIAQEAKLTPQVINSKVTHEYVLQANQTDWEFLQARARQIQYEVVVEDKKLFFRPVGNDKPEIITLTFMDDLLEFYPRVSAVGQVDEITVQGWDPLLKKQKIVGRGNKEGSKMGGKKSGAAQSQTAFSKASGVWTSHPIRTQQEADQLANANFNAGVLSFITGEGVCHGRTDLKAGKVIKIDGDRIGKQYRGQYYVTAVNHRLNARTSHYGPGGYYTHFTVQRNAF
ncbi:MAG: hypothetical protein KME60_12595 [Cyanomargarita calcarea GSE-NOS-MK-12-04C]|uniref:Phage late control D family protein n=1 Tax=Cyanomargarita calcarea GSE-NOS-MK-12-04C TaxID=2839659 RepID=A0A951QKV3_9CYAN|nr:hypothetical protein [Cyanomargarita calcarea GSE-NOS-MK-12-04C]